MHEGERFLQSSLSTGETKEEKLIKHPEIAELREPIQNLLEQLRDKIDKGEYGVIIGDDASGRIPALILDNVIKSVYQDKGYTKPKTIFFAGSKEMMGLGGEGFVKKKEKIFQYLNSLNVKKE